jgi:hypothetical protein
MIEGSQGSRSLGFDLGAPTPDENTIRHFRNRLTETGTLKRVMKGTSDRRPVATWAKILT